MILVINRLFLTGYSLCVYYNNDDSFPCLDRTTRVKIKGNRVIIDVVHGIHYESSPLTQ